MKATLLFTEAEIVQLIQNEVRRRVDTPMRSGGQVDLVVEGIHDDTLWGDIDPQEFIFSAEVEVSDE